jgi:hypothetical protein
MNNLQFLIGRKPKFYDVSDMIVKAVSSGARGKAPRDLKVTLLDSEQLASIDTDPSDGLICTFLVDGKEFFRGIVVSDNRGSGRTVEIHAMDNAMYLTKNKGSFTFKKKTATQIFKSVCKKANLKVGGAVNTKFRIKELTKKGTTFWDVIQDALSQTYSSTGKRYYVDSVKGKLYLRQRTESSSMIIADPGTNTTTYSQTRSIENTYTRLKLYSSTTKKKKTTTKVNKTVINKPLESKIGMMQDVESVDKKIKKSELKKKANTWKKDKSIMSTSMNWSGTGDTRAISGNSISVRVPQLGVNRVLYIDSDTHTWQNGSYTMQLTLNYAASNSDAG